MPSLKDVVVERTVLAESEVEWFHLRVADRQLIADLVGRELDVEQGRLRAAELPAAAAGPLGGPAVAG